MIVVQIIYVGRSPTTSKSSGKSRLITGVWSVCSCDWFSVSSQLDQPFMLVMGLHLALFGAYFPLHSDFALGM